MVQLGKVCNRRRCCALGYQVACLADVHPGTPILLTLSIQHCKTNFSLSIIISHNAIVPPQFSIGILSNPRTKLCSSVKHKISNMHMLCNMFIRHPNQAHQLFFSIDRIQPEFLSLHRDLMTYLQCIWMAYSRQNLTSNKCQGLWVPRWALPPKGSIFWLFPNYLLHFSFVDDSPCDFLDNLNCQKISASRYIR